MTEVMNAAIYENNLGVDCLEKYDFQQALRHFKSSAQLMYKVTQTFSVNNGYIEEPSPYQLHNVASSCNAQPPCTTSRQQQNSNESQQCSCQRMIRHNTSGPLIDEESFVCSCPIVLSFRNETSCAVMHGSDSCTVESAAILFNMGLTYHLNAMRPQALDHAMVNAVTLYEMAYSLGLQVPFHQQQRQRTHLHNEQELTHQIVMSSLNNLGQLHHQHGDFERTKFYMEDLYAYIMSLDEPSQREIALQRNEFMLNIMVLREPQGAAAA